MTHARLQEFADESVKIIEFLHREFAKLQTGRANAALLENIEVDAYDQKQHLKTLAGISVDDVRTLVIQPWDKSTAPNIEKALQEADLGASPNNDGNVIRISLPPMTEERREQLKKLVHQLAEEARISVRQQRQTIHDRIKDQEKDEDIRYTLLEQLQKEVDKANEEIETTMKKKGRRSDDRLGISYYRAVKTPKVAVISFPGNNCEVESLRSIKRAGMEAVFFRWNESIDKIADVDGYFIPGGFSYEDRGRAGMVPARDPVMQFIAEEAQKGKAVIGNCNGAQVLVESGLIPLDHGLKMSLARNVVDGCAVGFLNEWIYITPTCRKSRCVTSDWEGVMQIPIAHGEGRYTTKDPDVIYELQKNEQLAFSYCDEEGNVSTDPIITPNGSEYAIAGICNPSGNVVALMPHPERTPLGDPYFVSMKSWIEKVGTKWSSDIRESDDATQELLSKSSNNVEIFIDTIITNNEERTVEQAARRVSPKLSLTQLRYLSLSGIEPAQVLSSISVFNPNKEKAYVRRGKDVFQWNSDSKSETSADYSPLSDGIALLRRDQPDTGAASLPSGSETGVCYVCADVSEADLRSRKLQEIFANPHASTLEVLQ